MTYALTSNGFANSNVHFSPRPANRARPVLVTKENNVRALRPDPKRSFSAMGRCALRGVEKEILAPTRRLRALPKSSTWARLNWQLLNAPVTWFILAGGMSGLIGALVGAAMVTGIVRLTGSSLLAFGIVAGAMIGGALALAVDQVITPHIPSLRDLGRTASQGAMIGIVGGIVGFGGHALIHMHPFTSKAVVMTQAHITTHVPAPALQPVQQPQPQLAQQPIQQTILSPAPTLVAASTITRVASKRTNIPPPPPATAMPDTAEGWVQYQAWLTAANAMTPAHHGH
jgi:hypothetical protein